jgi:uncharacterized membrane protein YfcA
MRLLQIVGLLLILAAGYVLFRGVSYTSRRHVLEVGDFKAQVEEKQSIPPWVTGTIAGLGVALLVVGSRRK